MEFTIIKDISLKPYNTFSLNSTASLMAFPHSEIGLTDLLNKYKDTKEIIILGKGSNILFSKEHYSDEYLFINLKLLDQIDKVHIIV